MLRMIELEDQDINDVRYWAVSYPRMARRSPNQRTKDEEKRIRSKRKTNKLIRYVMYVEEVSSACLRRLYAIGLFHTYALRRPFLCASWATLGIPVKLWHLLELCLAVDKHRS